MSDDTRIGEVREVPPEVDPGDFSDAEPIETISGPEPTTIDGGPVETYDEPRDE